MQCVVIIGVCYIKSHYEFYSSPLLHIEYYSQLLFGLNGFVTCGYRHLLYLPAFVLFALIFLLTCYTFFCFVVNVLIFLLPVLYLCACPLPALPIPVYPFHQAL